VALAFGLTFTTVLFLVVTYYTRRLIRRVAQQDLVAALVSRVQGSADWPPWQRRMTLCPRALS
jgi:hypothetical protein